MSHWEDRLYNPGRKPISILHNQILFDRQQLQQFMSHIEKMRESSQRLGSYKFRIGIKLLNKA